MGQVLVRQDLSGQKEIYHLTSQISMPLINTRENVKGIYNHSAALGFHNGYRSFSHVTPSLSVVGSDAPLYPPQLYPCSGADYTSSFSASGRGSLSRSPGGIRFQDQLCGHRGFRSSGLCSDWLKSSNRHRPLIPASQQPRQFCGFSSASIPTTIVFTYKVSTKLIILKMMAIILELMEAAGMVFTMAGMGWVNASTQFCGLLCFTIETPLFSGMRKIVQKQSLCLVKLEKGVEILNIFRNYEANISILDDFDYYDNRQKATQERKSRDHNNSSGIRIVGGTEQTKVAIMHSKFIENMSKSFSQVVQLKDCSKDTSIPCRHGLRSDAPMSTRKKAAGTKNCSFARP